MTETRPNYGGIKRTKKLLAGCDVLSEERFCDCLPEDILKAVAANKTSVDQIYQALHHFGYRWQSGRGRWVLAYPKWIMNFHKISA